MNIIFILVSPGWLRTEAMERLRENFTEVRGETGRGEVTDRISREEGGKLHTIGRFVPKDF
jgi:hypothetical protein